MFKMNRRDFLKLGATFLAGSAYPSVSRAVSSLRLRDTSKPNILIFVFDAMSARHLSLSGYPRRTTPNLERFAERASVYHAHYAAGNFTTSGTASMLTGLYPWTHRAINYRGMINRRLANRNLFNLIGEEYTRVAFTQNLWADILLSQFENDLDLHLPCDSYSQVVHSLLQPHNIPGDRAIAYYAFEDFLNLGSPTLNSFPGSLFLASAQLSRDLVSDRDHISADFPRGLPTIGLFAYENESILQGINRLTQDLEFQSLPYLGYFHVWSPHQPYNARKEFIGIFQEDLKLYAKPRHPLSGSDYSEESLRDYRREYDEYIADVDAEFGRLLDDFDKSGVLQNSYVIVTSDHGELFERGELGHGSALIYDSEIKIPLLISAPGQQNRSDFYALTSNLDLLPTILHITGKEIPDWIEGKLLPGFGGIEDEARSVFSIVAKDNPSFQSIKQGTIAMIQGPYELLYYIGYRDFPNQFELYNLIEDPDERQDLINFDSVNASHLKEELLEAFAQANQSFHR
jgi:arylsulfatase A-like enzyme